MLSPIKFTQNTSQFCKKKTTCSIFPRKSPMPRQYQINALHFLRQRHTGGKCCIKRKTTLRDVFGK